MASASEKFGGGGGVFVPSFISGGQYILDGATAGNLLQLTPPSGERVMLYKIVAYPNPQPGITISGSVQGQIISGTIKYDAYSAGYFNIGTRGGSESYKSGTIPPVFFEPDEVVTFSADAATVEDIYYQYAFGGLK